MHLCGREHPCYAPAVEGSSARQPRLCGSSGICEIRSELHREVHTFNGARGDFEYEIRTRQVACR